MFKNPIIAALGILLLAGCHSGICLEVGNTLDVQRHPEMVELGLGQVEERLGLNDGESFVIIGPAGEEVPYQITYDGKVIFPVTMAAMERQEFILRKGKPSEYAVKVCGGHYPEREDDFCWENDVTGYRAYGFKDDLPSGYDLFVKRDTDLPVIRGMYAKAFDPELMRIHEELEKVDKDSADRFNCDYMTIHVDHGYGMDCYAVGRTLGAGVAALVDEGEIIYPFCYDSFEILENGPIRFTVRMVFRPFDVAGCKDVVETRLISVDLGSHFTRTSVTYEGLDRKMPLVTGIVVQDTDGKAVGDAEKGFIAYPAPTINYDRQRDVDNGTIFIGHVFPDGIDSAGLCYFSDEESAARGGSKGHILAHSQYDPQTPFIYYWGFGWDHSDIATYDRWLEYLEVQALQSRNPLTVKFR